MDPAANDIEDRKRAPGKGGLRPEAAGAAPATRMSGSIRTWGAVGFALVAILLYANTVNHGYVLDDHAVILQNRFTTEGLAGLGGILTQDTSAGIRGPHQILDRGRYRPLSLVSFALEWQFFPGNPRVGHVGNALLYALIAWLLFRVVWKLTRGHLGCVFATTALFVVHPVHTEVVANIKGRDELLSALLFLIAISCFGSQESGADEENAAGPPPGPDASAPPRSRPDGGAPARIALIGGIAAFGFALLSKETAVLFPLLLAAGMWFAGKSVRASLRIFLLLSGMAAIFLLWRFALVGRGAESMDPLNNPFYAVPFGQKLATIAVIQMRYLGLLLWPRTLSYDYSIRQIPPRSLDDPLVWLSLLLLGGLLLLTLDGIRRRALYGYGLLIYVAAITPVSNLLVNVGAPMGERFLFLPSLGFLLALTDLARRGAKKLRQLGAWESPAQQVTIVAGALVVLLSLLGSGRTIARNRDWATNETLFLADVKNAPNSAKTNKAAAGIWIERGAQEENPERRIEDLERAIVYLRRAIEIYPDYADAYLDLGMAYRLNGQSELAESVWNRFFGLCPESPLGPTLHRYLADSYLDEGRRLASTGHPSEAARRFRAALRILPGHPAAREALGQSQGADSSGR